MNKSFIEKKEVESLTGWFREFAVEYPWGDNPTPYRVWISEIMLQQTVVTAAIDHFNNWMDLFPDVRSLAQAGEQAVLKAWEGLGYYSRARNIRKGALFLIENHQGALPDSYDELIKVPGIGDYTARAVLSLAFSKNYAVLDANVRRIGQRLMARREWQKPDDQFLLDSLESVIPREAPGEFNCALMQLGQQICRVRSPDCSLCPFTEVCRTRAAGLQGEIPAPRKRKIREKKSSLFLFIAEGRILLTRRSRGIGKGLWFIPSLPYGEETSLPESLEINIKEYRPLAERVHLYTTWKEFLYPRLYFLKSLPVEELPWIRSHEGDEVRWISPEDLDSYPTPSVYRKILDEFRLI